MTSHNNIRFHILAFFVVLIWGTTFVSTKTLINNGLTAINIYIARILLAYICICFIAPKKLFADTTKDELTLVAMGITGGSLYFLTENYALAYSFASNVSLIVCTTPLFTTILYSIISKEEKFSKRHLLGSIIAFIGMTFVVLNGHFVLNLSPIGDFLALMAAFSWAIYSCLIKKISRKYSNLFITRKVFFYGLLTALPVATFTGFNYSTQILSQPIILCNILFLGLIASMLCFVLWNVVIKHLGVIQSSNYIYLNPVVAVICSAFILSEKITQYALLGMMLILLGIFISQNTQKIKVKKNQ